MYDSSEPVSALYYEEDDGQFVDPYVPELATSLNLPDAQRVPGAEEPDAGDAGLWECPGCIRSGEVGGGARARRFLASASVPSAVAPGGLSAGGRAPPPPLLRRVRACALELKK